MKLLSFVLLTCFVLVACSSDTQDGTPQSKKPVPVVTGIGEPTGSPASAVIGSAGGSLKSPDGALTLTVPPGALTADTTLTIQPLSNLAPGGVGSAYRLGPEGQTFAVPVTLTRTYGDPDVTGSAAEALGIAFQTSDRHWQWESSSNVDTNAKTVVASTAHFSDWSLVKGFQLRPPKAKVKIKDSLLLRVVFCYVPDDTGEEIASVGYDCESDDDATTPVVPTAKLGAWMVNGVAGGNAASGTITGVDAIHARYDAPAVKPDASHNPVAVSVQVDLGSTQKTLVTTPVEVTDDSVQYKGTVTLSGPLTNTFLPGPWNVNLSAEVTLAATSGSAFLVVPAETTVTIESLDYDANGAHCALSGGFTTSASGVLITPTSTTYAPTFSFSITPVAPYYTCSGANGSFQTASSTVKLDLQCDEPFLPTQDLKHLEGACTTKPLTTVGGETLHATFFLNVK